MSRFLRAAGALLVATAALVGCSADSADPQTSASAPASVSDSMRLTETPVVIGHRGASGYRPEHTLASYRLAAEMGADFVDVDLVSTKDHVLIARHENDITGTTNVADLPQYAGRKRTKTIDGTSITGWFSEDFTLAEIKTLRAKERLPDLRPQNTKYGGKFQIPTLEEVLELRAKLSAELGRSIGVYPETKHPTYFQSIGLDLETPLVNALKANGLDQPDSPVFIQSFELTNLVDLRVSFGIKVPLVLLTAAGGAPYDLASTGDPRTYASLTSADGLQQVAEYVDGIGPDKRQVISAEVDGALGVPTSLVADAHAAGLLVHPYTFRAENKFLPVNLQSGGGPAKKGDEVAEQIAYLKAGVDGLFTDQPDLGVEARKKFLDGD